MCFTWAQDSSGVLALTEYRVGKSKRCTGSLSRWCSKAGAKWELCPEPGAPDKSKRGRYAVGCCRAELATKQSSLLEKYPKPHDCWPAVMMSLKQQCHSRSPIVSKTKDYCSFSPILDKKISCMNFNYRTHVSDLLKRIFFMMPIGSDNTLMKAKNWWHFVLS